MEEISIDVVEKSTNQLLDAGIIGVFCIFLMCLVIWIIKRHEVERTTWYNKQEKKDELHAKSQEKRDEKFIQASEKLSDSISALSKDIWSNSNNNSNK